MELSKNKYVKGKYQCLAELNLDTMYYPRKNEERKLPKKLNVPKDSNITRKGVEFYIPSSDLVGVKIYWYEKTKEGDILSLYTSKKNWSVITERKKGLTKYATKIMNDKELEYRFLDKHLDKFAMGIKAPLYDNKIGLFTNKALNLSREFTNKTIEQDLENARLARIDLNENRLEEEEEN